MAILRATPKRRRKPMTENLSVCGHYAIHCLSVRVIMGPQQRWLGIGLWVSEWVHWSRTESFLPSISCLVFRPVVLGILGFFAWPLWQRKKKEKKEKRKNKCQASLPKSENKRLQDLSPQMLLFATKSKKKSTVCDKSHTLYRLSYPGRSDDKFTDFPSKIPRCLTRSANLPNIRCWVCSKSGDTDVSCICVYVWLGPDQKFLGGRICEALRKFFGKLHILKFIPMHARSHYSDTSKDCGFLNLYLYTIRDSQGVTVACGASGRLRQGRCLNSEGQGPALASCVQRVRHRSFWKLTQKLPRSDPRASGQRLMNATCKSSGKHDPDYRRNGDINSDRNDSKAYREPCAENRAKSAAGMTVSYGQFAARSNCMFNSTGGAKVAGLAMVSIKETAEVQFEATALLIDRWHQKLNGTLLEVVQPYKRAELELFCRNSASCSFAHRGAVDSKQFWTNQGNPTEEDTSVSTKMSVRNESLTLVYVLLDVPSANSGNYRLCVSNDQTTQSVADVRKANVVTFPFKRSSHFLECSLSSEQAVVSDLTCRPMGQEIDVVGSGRSRGQGGGTSDGSTSHPIRSVWDFIVFILQDVANIHSGVKPWFVENDLAHMAEICMDDTPFRAEAGFITVVN
ncbi:hypothetical protein KCU83_g78, partial [Aureobasidium melanogenum]